MATKTAVGLRLGYAGGLLVLAAMLVSQPGHALQTSTPSPSATAQSAPAAAPARPRRRHRHRTAQPAAANPPSQTGQNTNETAAQKAEDQRLLQQQISASQATKQINDQQVRQYDANRQKIQNEPRIQDAPGPAQTPVPGAAPSAANPDPQGIQEAPGPAQTQPQPAPAPATPQA